MPLVQGIECMEELLLCPLFSRQELNVVDHEHIDVSIALPEIHHLVIANGVDHLVGKLFRGQVGDAQIGSFRHMIAYGV